MFGFLEGWLIYPVSELVHALQGVLAGWLGSRAIIKKEVSDALCALLVTIAFATYETLEMVRIHDHGDQDFQNFWIVCVATGLIYAGIHLWRSRRKNGSY